MRNLSLADIILLHEKVIAKTGGSQGIRDINLIESGIGRAFATFDGKDLYKTIEAKIAVITHSLISNHGFIDGNKRVGIVAMLLLLKLNGYTLCYSQQELIDLSLGIAAGKFNEHDIQAWITGHRTI